VSHYYYFAATLPSLRFDAAPPFSFARFQALCAEHLSPSDRRALHDLEGPPNRPARHPFARAWREAECALRNACARLRARRLGQDPTPHLRGGAEDGAATRAAAEAFALPSPLDRETALDRFRWARAGELGGLNPFSSDAVLAYGIQLKLAERRSALREDNGMRRTAWIVERPPVGVASQGERI
jgi:hypothetical protein